MTQFNSNIERQNHANATKEEKARHNGVNTSRWNNDCPRIAVPEGWQDHQGTQQLIRKYLTNDVATYIFANRCILLFLTVDEQKAISHENGINKFPYINQTFLGLCIDIRLRKLNDYEGIDDNGKMSVNGAAYDVNGNAFASSVKILTCTDDRQTVILQHMTIERAKIEELASKDKDFRFLSNIGIEHHTSFCPTGVLKNRLP